MLWHTVTDIIFEKLKCSESSSSINPVITISKSYLRKLDLWENTVRLSGTRRSKSYVYYEGLTKYGLYLQGSDLPHSFDLTLVKQRTIILLAYFKEWQE